MYPTIQAKIHDFFLNRNYLIDTGISPRGISIWGYHDILTEEPMRNPGNPFFKELAGNLYVFKGFIEKNHRITTRIYNICQRIRRMRVTQTFFQGTHRKNYRKPTDSIHFSGNPSNPINPCIFFSKKIIGKQQGAHLFFLRTHEKQGKPNIFFHETQGNTQDTTGNQGNPYIFQDTWETYVLF